MNAFNQPTMTVVFLPFLLFCAHILFQLTTEPDQIDQVLHKHFEEQTFPIETRNQNKLPPCSINREYDNYGTSLLVLLLL